MQADNSHMGPHGGSKGFSTAALITRHACPLQQMRIRTRPVLRGQKLNPLETQASQTLLVYRASIGGGLGTSGRQGRTLCRGRREGCEQHVTGTWVHMAVQGTSWSGSRAIQPFATARCDLPESPALSERVEGRSGAPTSEARSAQRLCLCGRGVIRGRQAREKHFCSRVVLRGVVGRSSLGPKRVKRAGRPLPTLRELQRVRTASQGLPPGKRLARRLTRTSAHTGEGREALQRCTSPGHAGRQWGGDGGGGRGRGSSGEGLRRVERGRVIARAAYTEDRSILVKIQLAAGSGRLDLSELGLESIPEEVFDIEGLEVCTGPPTPSFYFPLIQVHCNSR
jgi:hypothetical protein